ncbi:MAG: hypothetical protein H5U40_08005, partial [Polyangiaceae bacterium]|nr:hypothetical protein [Polyangiaceae bacterium]
AGGHASVFLRPLDVPASARVEVVFDAPAGVSVSTAWPSDGRVYRPARSFLDREAHLAFGKDLELSRFEVAGAQVERARLPGTLAITDDELDAWLARALRAVASLVGRFPHDRVQVVIVPVSRGTDPVPFGLVRRGGGASVLLLMSERAELAALDRDWVAVHELSHLLFPRVARPDAWLGEGLATYYQEVLRSRAGLIAPRDAWRRLIAEFTRGRRDASELPLGVESERMMETRRFHRVYWSGAAFGLLADLELRRRGTSLDALIAERSSELVSADGSVTALELLAALERPLGSGVLTTLADGFERTRGFPDVSSALAALGIRVDEDGEVSFSDAPEARALRAAIVGGDSEP